MVYPADFLRICYVTTLLKSNKKKNNFIPIEYYTLLQQMNTNIIYHHYLPVICLSMGQATICYFQIL